MPENGLRDRDLGRVRDVPCPVHAKSRAQGTHMCSGVAWTRPADTTAGWAPTGHTHYISLVTRKRRRESWRTFPRRVGITAATIRSSASPSATPHPDGYALEGRCFGRLPSFIASRSNIRHRSRFASRHACVLTFTQCRTRRIGRPHRGACRPCPRGRCSATRSSAGPSSNGSESETAG